MPLSFQQVVDKLRQAKIPCKVKEFSDEICIEFGFNWPEELLDKCAEVGIKPNDQVAMMGSSEGGHIIRSVLVCGGPKNY